MKDPIRSKSSLVPIRFRQSPATIPQSCHQISLADPNATSGMYYIDPDGENVGELPIYVFCDMSTGSTLVGHDSESSIQVSRCADAGCYQRPINYMAPMMQIKALSAVSTQCRQSIQVSKSSISTVQLNLMNSFLSMVSTIAVLHHWSSTGSSTPSGMTSMERSSTFGPAGTQVAMSASAGSTALASVQMCRATVTA